MMPLARRAMLWGLCDHVMMCGTRLYCVHQRCRVAGLSHARMGLLWDCMRSMDDVLLYVKARKECCIWRDCF